LFTNKRKYLKYIIEEIKLFYFVLIETRSIQLKVHTL